MIFLSNIFIQNKLWTSFLYLSKNEKSNYSIDLIRSLFVFEIRFWKVFISFIEFHDPYIKCFFRNIKWQVVCICQRLKLPIIQSIWFEGYSFFRFVSECFLYLSENFMIFISNFFFQNKIWTAYLYLTKNEKSNFSFDLIRSLSFLRLVSKFFISFREFYDILIKYFFSK